MKNKIYIYVILMMMLLSGLSSGQTAGTSTPLTFGVGSRELALGGADITECDFTTASYWNPARLAHGERLSLTGFHTRLYDADIAYQYLGIVIPSLDWGSIGIGIVRLGIDNIEERDEANLLLGTIDDTRLGFRLAYGRTVGSLDLGMALSLETHSLGTYKTTSTPGLDFAASKTINSPFPWCDNLTLSIVGRNLLAPSMKLVDESVKLPAEFHAGISTKIATGYQNRYSLEISGGFNKTDQSDPIASFGMEYSMFELLKIRGGLRDDQLSGGVGLSCYGISVDYAVVDRELGLLHMISLTTAIGKPADERRLLRAKRREEAFSRAMNDRLTKQNIELAEQLLASGKKAMTAGDLTTADDNFDRALFLSRSSGLDTTEYARLATQARSEIAERDRRITLSAHLDSARVRLAASDYLGCQYFADLALAVDSASAEAITLRDRAASSTLELSRHQEFIQQKILAIDSLIGYGKYDEALTAARTVSQMAPDNTLARQTLKKAEFESFHVRAEMAIARRDYQTAVALLDSALLRFPEQSHCLEMKRQARQAENDLRVMAASETPAPTALSRELQKQVQDIYEKAQSAFNRGELKQAMTAWEEVERLAPGYQSVRDYLVKVYRFIGVDLYGKNLMKEALAIWNKALAIAPDNSEIAAYARRTQNEIEKLKELSNDN
jgi:tetratricopeptide (TPR) repeat protein